MADYTDPELRERIKKRIKAAGKGGKKGQWSARKSQLLVREYEKQGGGYKGEKDKRQKSLEKWGGQDWQTESGGAAARGKGGTKRYLPDVAWKLLSKSEREATDGKKQRGADQFVANTKPAKEARKAAELLDMKAGEARRAVAKMDTKSALKRARKAEAKHGKGRKTVLAAIEKRRSAL